MSIFTIIESGIDKCIALIKKLIGEDAQQQDLSYNDELEALIRNAIESQNSKLGIEDLLDWTQRWAESLIDNGVAEVNAIKGEALAEYLTKVKNATKHGNIDANTIETISTCIVFVAMNNDGDIVETQLITAKGGMSSQLVDIFNGQPILKIKITD